MSPAPIIKLSKVTVAASGPTAADGTRELVGPADKQNGRSPKGRATLEDIERLTSKPLGRKVRR